MSDALSIFAAAREAGDSIGLHVGQARHSFADLARLTERRLHTLAREPAPALPHPLVGRHTLEALVTLYALLELGRPALLLHPRLTEADHVAERQAAARAGAAELHGLKGVRKELLEKTLALQREIDQAERERDRIEARRAAHGRRPGLHLLPGQRSARAN